MIEYQLLGEPTPLHRPRFGKGHAYDDQKQKKLVDWLSIKHQHDKLPYFMESIQLDATFIFETPKSWSKKQKDFWLNKPCNNRIDLDNLLKYLADVCIGVCYTDDRIITSISAEKIYGIQAKTLFTFTKI